MVSKEALLNVVDQGLAENAKNVLAPVDLTQPIECIVSDLRFRLEEIVKLSQGTQLRPVIANALSDQDAIATAFDAVNALDQSVKDSGLSGDIIGAINLVVNDAYKSVPDLIRA